MRTAPPGTLLKHQTAGRSTLVATPQSRRLMEHLHDLITIAYEHSTYRHSNSLHLTRLEYASGENSDGKFCMHFVALVKAANLDASVPLRLSITVKQEDWLC